MLKGAIACNSCGLYSSLMCKIPAVLPGVSQVTFSMKLAPHRADPLWPSVHKLLRALVGARVEIAASGSVTRRQVAIFNTYQALARPVFKAWPLRADGLILVAQRHPNDEEAEAA